MRDCSWWSSHLLETTPEKVEKEIAKGLDIKGAYESRQSYSSYIEVNIIVPPLICAAKSDNIKVVEVLLKHGADVNGNGVDGETALMGAVHRRNFAMAEMLIKSGANVNAQDNNGDSILEYASNGSCSADGEKMVKYLLQNGANRDIRNNQGKTPLDNLDDGTRGYPLPNRQEVSEQISKFINQYKGMKGVSVDTSAETLSALTNASLGLTYAEIENCLARALVEDHKLDINDIKSIVNEKKQIIRKSGILEYVENKLSLEDVGGLTVLKRWLELRGKTFSEDAKAFGLNPPKGVLLVGIPGCGKSLTAKCIASAWSMPLLKLDMGRIFGKYVGDSEANIRQALKTAEAIAPCVLWIDEIEKGLSGGGSDGGTSSRVFGNILTWMQDKTSPVFTFATANNIRNLPPELLRKGRFDEIFFVDLPDFEERKKILEIHIGKSGRNLANFDLDKLAKMSGEDNYGTNVRLAGAEIEAWVKDALMEAYARKANGDINADLSMQDFETVIKRMIPMAKMRQEDFKDLRDWANENAVSASVSSATTSNSNDSLGGRRIDLI